MKKIALIIPMIVLFLVLAACNGVEYEDPFTRAENALEAVIEDIPSEIDTETVALPGEYDDYIITWESDNPDVISPDGTVNRPADEAVTVTLTATTNVMEYDDFVSRDVTVTVLPE